MSSLRRIPRRLRDSRDVARDLRCPASGLGQVSTDLFRRHRLLLDRTGDRRLDAADLLDDATHLVDRFHCRGDVVLNGFDPLTDFVRRLRCLLRQFLDLVGDDREALSDLSGARRFDRRVESQEIGLLGDRSDDLDDVADVLAALAELHDAGVSGHRHLHAVGRDAGRLMRLSRDFSHTGRHLLGSCRDRLHAP